jgi:hypothetical protein
MTLPATTATTFSLSDGLGVSAFLQETATMPNINGINNLQPLRLPGFTGSTCERLRLAPPNLGRNPVLINNGPSV